MPSVIGNTHVHIEMTRTDLLAIRSRLAQIDFILLSHGDMTAELTKAREKINGIHDLMKNAIGHIDEAAVGITKLQTVMDLIQPNDAVGSKVMK